MIEVVVATGICTYALLIIASLLPVGLGSIQTASQQVAQTEIYNQICSEVNTTPYGNIAAYPGLTNTAYYDINGTPTTQASSVFIVVCTQPKVTLPSSSGGTYATNEMTAVQVQIGYHINPATAAAHDPRVSTRTFLVVRKDGSLNSIANGW